jgi:hypothetical protein
MFGSEESMIRLDMSEYMEKHTVAKLIGSPPGYVGYNEGGQLTEAVRSQPYSVVLLDEVEKAHPDVFNLLLQILDDGRLTDSKGRLIDFTNTLIVMTTNLGSKVIERESGIKPKSQQEGSGLKLTTNEGIFGWEPAPEVAQDSKIREKVKKLVNDELKNFFRPEFLNRIDEIIVFSHLTRRDLWEICDLMIKSLIARLKDKEIDLIVRKPVQALLTDEGYDPLYGARPLRRAIMHYLEDELAEKCLSQTLYPRTRITVDRKSLADKKNEIKKITNNDNINVQCNSDLIKVTSLNSMSETMSEAISINKVVKVATVAGGMDLSIENLTYESDSNDYRDSETYTNELKIEIDFSAVDQKLLNVKVEEKQVEDNNNKTILIAGVPIVVEKLRGLIEASNKEEDESDDIIEEDNITEPEALEEEAKEEEPETDTPKTEESKPKRNRFALIKKIGAAIFGTINRFR